MINNNNNTLITTSTTSTEVSAVSINENLVQNPFPGASNVVGGEILSPQAAGERRLETLLQGVYQQRTLDSSVISTNEDIVNFSENTLSLLHSVSGNTSVAENNRLLVLQLLSVEYGNSPNVLAISNNAILNASAAVENGIRQWPSLGVVNMEHLRQLIQQRNNTLFSYRRYSEHVGRPIQEAVSDYNLYEFLFSLGENSLRELVFFF